MTKADNPFSWLGGGASGAPEEMLKQNEAMQEAAQVRRMEFARLVFDVFGTGRGPELLQELRNFTIEVPLMNVGASIVDGEVALSPADWAYVREGQNSIVRMLERNMLLATQPNTEGEDHDGEG